MVTLFWDEPHGGFYLTAHHAEALITRPKEVYDGAVPSGNSMAALAFLKLDRLTGENRWSPYADLLLEAFSGSLADSPANFTQMLVALDLAMEPRVCSDGTCPLPEKKEKG